VFVDDIREAASGLTADELRRAIEELQAMVVRALAGPDEEPTACPRCGCTVFVRDGFDKKYSCGRLVEKLQRYECRGCGRSFTRRTDSLLSLSKLDVGTWTKFVELECRQAPLKECKEKLQVTAPTVHYMRMRMCDVMGRLTPAAGCGEGDSVQVDGTYLNESPEGMGRRGAQMPREAHENGNGVHSRGISNEKVCVLVGVDGSGRQFAEVCDRGRPSDQRILECLDGKVGPGCAVSTDDHKAYARVLPQLGVTNHLVFPTDGSNGNGLYAVNAAHARLKDFLRGFHGVSTKYLDLYCKWNNFLEFVRKAGRDLEAALQDLVARGRYDIRRDSLYGGQRPFWDYWEGKMPQAGEGPILCEEVA
jgi:transposase-like protein